LPRCARNDLATTFNDLHYYYKVVAALGLEGAQEGGYGVSGVFGGQGQEFHVGGDFFLQVGVAGAKGFLVPAVGVDVFPLGADDRFVLHICRNVHIQVYNLRGRNRHGNQLVFPVNVKGDRLIDTRRDDSFVSHRVFDFRILVHQGVGIVPVLQSMELVDIQHLGEGRFRRGLEVPLGMIFDGEDDEEYQCCKKQHHED